MFRVAVIMGKMNTGGRKNLVMEYYRHIDRTKVQFDFFCDMDSNAIPIEEIESLGGHVHMIPPYESILNNMAAIRRICRENKYPIIHGYNSTMNIFAMLAGKMAGIPIRINECISMGHKDDKRDVLKRLLKPFAKCFSTHYMSNGEVCGRWQFGNRVFDKGKVIVFKTVIDTEKNRFDLGIRERMRKELNVEQNIVIGHIGRLTAQKNTLFVIDVFNEIYKIEPKARLLLIGDGELREAMIKRIEEYEITEQVIYLGRREDIQPFYNAMDSFLLPSLYEGLPIVGVEAECCGLPVFFSSEIPKESNACSDLGHFIDLSSGAKEWAKIVIESTKNNIPRRNNRSDDLKKGGFDSKLEANRLLKYYYQVMEI